MRTARSNLFVGAHAALWQYRPCARAAVAIHEGWSASPIREGRAGRRKVATDGCGGWVELFSLANPYLQRIMLETVSYRKLGLRCLYRRDGDVVHVETFTLWDDETAIRRFAGKNMEVARYYEFDQDFLLELEPRVLHFGVID